jgi:dihydroneopterin aldolase
VNRDVVFIEGLRVEAVIGVHDWERRATQPLRLDLELDTDTRAAAASDALRDAVDYSAVCARVVALVRESRCELVETLAEACCAMLLREFRVARVRLRLTKPGAVPEAEGVGIRIERGTPA